MKTKLTLFCFIGFISANATSIDCFRSNPNSIWTVFHNASFLASKNKIEYGLGIENKFTKELNTIYAACLWPSSSGNWHASYSHFGYSNYHEHEVGVGLSKIITPHLAASLRFIGFFQDNPSYYHNHFLSDIDFSLSSKFKNFFRLNTRLRIPFRFKKNKIYNEPVRNLFNLQLSYLFSKNLSLSFLFDYNTQNISDLSLQILYYPVKSFGISTTFSINKHYGFSILYSYKNIETSLSYSHQQIIGYTTNLAISHLLQK